MDVDERVPRVPAPETYLDGDALECIKAVDGKLKQTKKNYFKKRFIMNRNNIL